MDGSRRICLQYVGFKEDKDDESHSCSLELLQKLTEKFSQEGCVDEFFVKPYVGQWRFN